MAMGGAMLSELVKILIH